MIEVLFGMAGSLIVGAGFAGGYLLGKWSAKREQAKLLAGAKKEETEDVKIPVSQQFENLMAYSGRVDR